MTAGNALVERSPLERAGMLCQYHTRPIRSAAASPTRPMMPAHRMMCRRSGKSRGNRDAMRIAHAPVIACIRANRMKYCGQNVGLENPDNTSPFSSHFPGESLKPRMPTISDSVPVPPSARMKARRRCVFGSTFSRV